MAEHIINKGVFMIVVTGASGQLGRAVVERLKDRVDASRVVALSRDPDKIADLGVTTRAADFDDEDGLARAFDGADRLYMISTDKMGSDRIAQHTNVINAASRAGVGHVLYTSQTRADEPDNPAMVMSDHRATEEALAASGLRHTTLRHNLYADIFVLMSATSAVASGVLATNAGDGGAAYITREDCAEVGAAVLAADDDPGRVLEVTGPASVTGADFAAILSEITGRQIPYEQLTDEQFVAGAVASGAMPEPMAQGMATFGRATREGYFDIVTDVARRFTGRAPTGVHEFLTANRAALGG
jgi:NAD(P)H dehydrogenase (quinone)